MASRAQILATLGPSCLDKKVFFSMVENHVDLVRLNFSWGDYAEKSTHIHIVRDAEEHFHIKIPIVIDLPGPRIQKGEKHSYATDTLSALTETDKKHIEFGIKENVDWIALSFVGSPKDIVECRTVINSFGGKQKIIAKIERSKALSCIDDIIKAADAIMVARGDLGQEVPLEKIPFIEADIIQRCNKAGKPVITATGMLLSMTENPTPSRAEVTDVTAAILLGSDAVMLSEETARGKYPVQAVLAMENILLESERHMKHRTLHTL